jgi:hypothetical protein
MAGRFQTIIATQSGGSNYSPGFTSVAGNPISVSGIAGAQMEGMTVTSTNENTCTACFYAGNTAGTLTFTDNVNSTTATLVTTAMDYMLNRTFTGATAYIGSGGCEDLAAPIASNDPGNQSSGTADLPLYVQVIGHNAYGSTKGVLTPQAGEGGYTLNFPNGEEVDYFTGPPNRVLTINDCPSAVDFIGGAAFTLTWSMSAGCASADLVWSNSNGAPFTWNAFVTNTTLTTFVVNTLTSSTYSLPTANTTQSSTASDSNAGTQAAPWATALHGNSVVAAANNTSPGTYGTIFYSGVTNEASPVTFAGGVEHYFDTTTFTQLNSSYGNTLTAAFQLTSGSNFINLNLKSESFGEVVLSSGTNAAPAQDVYILNYTVTGWTNAIRCTAVNSAVRFVGGTSSSVHGTFGIYGGGVCVNVEYGGGNAVGSATLQGTGTVAMLVNATDFGYVCMRDCYFTSRRDSLNAVNWIDVACSVNAGSIMLINSHLQGVNYDLQAITIGRVDFVNTPLDGAKNQKAVNTLGARLTQTQQGVYQLDPLLISSYGVPLASTVKSGTTFGPDVNGATSGTYSGGGGGSTAGTSVGPALAGFP